MPHPDPIVPGPSIDSIFDESTPDLHGWSQLLHRIEELPLRRRPGFLGWVLYHAKRVLRPLVKGPQNEYWEFQRRYNLALLQFLSSHGEDLESSRHVLSAAISGVGEDLQTVQNNLVRDLQEHLERHRGHEERLIHLEGFKREGFDDVMEHMDAAAALLDQKLDRYRRESQTMWGRLGGLLAVSESSDPKDLARTSNEKDYVQFEERFRGTEAEIGLRISRYLEYLKDKSRVLDLGCGRGEALEFLQEHGVPHCGIDSSAEMIKICHEKGLEANQGDLLDELSALQEGSLGGIVSFHVIEHLSPEAVARLVRLSWRALEPGGILILETPNPMALVVGARNFWLDPTVLTKVFPAERRLALNKIALAEHFGKCRIYSFY